jgi:FkbH-like protein
MSDESQSAKCVVWDLDDTLWQGILLEDECVRLRPNVDTILRTLDSRGILLSIASRSDHALAMRKLREFGLDGYFLHPQINWNSKAESIRTIAEALNIGLDAIAFVDDQLFERDEVKFSLPQVLCIDAEELPRLLDMPVMNPKHVTEDSRMRRHMYVSDMARKEAEQQYEGPQEAFLASLNMILTIFPAREEDLQRAEELTVRTHQMNTTGVTYSYDELNRFRQSDRYDLLMTRLEDKYGTYGHVGLALIERGPSAWTIRLLLTSCRVIARGVGSLMLTHIVHVARQRQVRLLAHFVPNERNRMMYVAYRFAGFREIARDDGSMILEHDPAQVREFPDYVKLVLQ